MLSKNIITSLDDSTVTPSWEWSAIQLRMVEYEPAGPHDEFKLQTYLLGQRYYVRRFFAKENGRTRFFLIKKYIFSMAKAKSVHSSDEISEMSGFAIDKRNVSTRLFLLVG